MLAGKTEAYVYLPLQLSPMETEALQGEAAVRLPAEIVKATISGKQISIWLPPDATSSKR